MTSTSNQSVLSATTSRLKKELMELVMNPPSSSTADPCAQPELSAFPASEADILYWKAVIVGPKV